MSRNNNGKLGEQIGRTDTAQLFALRPALYGESAFPFSVAIHETIYPDWRARFATTCIERWGMVAGEASGEDSAGRSKLRRLSPQEIVEHACECADRAYAAFSARDWLLKLPDAEALQRQIHDRENTND